jgi:hypothetical protein
MLPLVVDPRGDVNGGKLIKIHKTNKFFHPGKYTIVL